MNIHKTFSDILEDAVIEKFNPNHDQLGRFTTSGGGGAATNNTSSSKINGGFKKVGERTENGKTITYGESDLTRKVKADVSASAKDPKKGSKVDSVIETRDENGETLSWEIGVKGSKHKVVIESTDSSKDPENIAEDFFAGVDEAKAALTKDIDAMNGCDLEHFGMVGDRFEVSGNSKTTASEEYLDRPLEFEIVKEPKYYPATWDSPAEYDDGEIGPAYGSDPEGLLTALEEIYSTY